MTDVESSEHADLEEWARKFGGTAILGFISTLLLAGKFLHHIFQRRGLVCGLVVAPPALLSGLIGLLWFSTMEYLDPIMTADMRLGLEALKGNLINFVFAALILGITCGRANSQHNASFRGLVTSLFHEGMPMVIYSQILNWGQTTLCLLLVCIGNTFFNAKIPRAFAAMVPLGLEAGADISVSSNYKVKTASTKCSVLRLILITSKPNCAIRLTGPRRS
jgi:biotin transporter BioY